MFYCFCPCPVLYTCLKVIEDTGLIAFGFLFGISEVPFTRAVTKQSHKIIFNESLLLHAMRASVTSGRLDVGMCTSSNLLREITNMREGKVAECGKDFRVLYNRLLFSHDFIINAVSLGLMFVSLSVPEFIFLYYTTFTALALSII